MAVSVVIPARNAEATLAETIASLQAQTRPDWEAVIVDDRSTDGTRGVADSLAAADTRIGVVSGSAKGVGAARNLGLENARREHVLFLDADDLLRPTFLAAMAAALEPDARLAGAHCGWTRLAPGGETAGDVVAERSGDLFEEFAGHCLFPIHACVVLTDLVREVGGFDTSLVTCEDWDLWLRVARTGRRFAAVPEVLALYRMRESSASVNGRRMHADGLEVIARARRPDPRVPDSVTAHRFGHPPDDLVANRLLHTCWTAGLVLGSGADATTLLPAVAQDVEPALDANWVAHNLSISSLLPRCLTPAAWPDLLPELGDRLAAFLEGLERVSRSAGLARRAQLALERRILAQPGGRRPLRVGSMLAVDLDAAAALEDVEPERGVERVLCAVRYGADRVGTIELPVLDGRVSAASIADAIAADLSWLLLTRYLEETLNGRASPGPGDDEQAWVTLLQDLVGRPDLPPERFYDGNADLGSHVTLASAAPVVELAEPLPSLAAPDGTVEIVATLGGAPLGLVSIDAPDGSVAPGRVLASLVRAAGFELARAAVRQGVVGQPPGGTLRERLAGAARGREDGSGIPADAMVLARRRPFEIGGADSREVALPSAAAPELAEAAGAANEPVIGDPFGAKAVRYDPSVVRAAAPTPDAGHDGTVDRSFFERIFAETVDPWDYTSPYEVTKYEQTLELVPERAGRALELGCAEGHFTERLATRVGRLVAADISEVALERARERCRDRRNVEFVRLDLSRDALPDRLDVLVCSEVLYYLASREELERVASRLASALRPGGRLVTAHANVVVDARDEPGFEWSVPFGGKAIGAALRRSGGLELEIEVRTPFYRVQRFRRPGRWGRVRRRRPIARTMAQPAPLPLPAAPTARWEGIDWPQGVGPTTELPILMYHRVARDGGDRLARYRLHPERFAEQLRLLGDAGFRTVGFEEAGRALRNRQALPGRAVMLTFDDGSRDFLTDAWPLLRAHGFGATLFVVSDRVGGTNDWDAAYGERVDLLDWDELRQLARAGVEIGSHTASHPHLTALSPEDVVREAARSRATIIREVGVEPAAIAYPYGDSDAVIRRLAGGAGYAYGVTAESRRAALVDDPLGLPRIEVTATFSRADLIDVLGVR